jgi:acetyl esterase/lipase
MPKSIALLFLASVSSASAFVSPAPARAETPQEAEPDAFVYEQAGGKDWKVYVFEPAKSDYRKPRAAVLVFHAGGWSVGSAEWTFGQARYFASLGMVGISVEYRLSDGKTVTPFDAVEDAKAAVRWVRGRADVLNVDPKKVAAYGESAGAFLAAATAITSDSPTKEELNSVPNALVLFSPALNIEQNERFKQLAGTEHEAASISPMRHVRREMPPTLILTGELDTQIPATFLIEYCEKMKQVHNRCELQVSLGVGHMLQPPDAPGAEGGPDSKARYQAFLKLDQFLLSLGFLPKVPQKN